MSSYLADAANRALAISQEACATIGTTLDGKPYWPYQQDRFPYMTIRHGSETVDYTKYAPDIEDNPEQLLLRLVLAHITEGFEGDIQTDGYALYIALRDYWRTRSMLTTIGTVFGDYTAEPDYLDPDTGAYISAHTGTVVFSNSGLLTPQLGYEFTLQIPFMQSVY